MEEGALQFCATHWRRCEARPNQAPSLREGLSLVPPCRQEVSKRNVLVVYQAIFTSFFFLILKFILVCSVI